MLDRRAAGDWIARAAGRPMRDHELRHWEKVGVIEGVGHGVGVPAGYGAYELFVGVVTALLLDRGFPLATIKGALLPSRETLRTWIEKRGPWQLAVTSSGSHPVDTEAEADAVILRATKAGEFAVLIEHAGRLAASARGTARPVNVSANFPLTGAKEYTR
jgi:hypothetical protein